MATSIVMCLSGDYMRQIQTKGRVGKRSPQIVGVHYLLRLLRADCAKPSRITHLRVVGVRDAIVRVVHGHRLESIKDLIPKQPRRGVKAPRGRCQALPPLCFKYLTAKVYVIRIQHRQGQLLLFRMRQFLSRRLLLSALGFVLLLFFSPEGLAVRRNTIALHLIIGNDIRVNLKMCLIVTTDRADGPLLLGGGLQVASELDHGR
mmetsp:Transcript_9802/g.23191  ORF Transcript_9802/g.23191 Transcript_9802/m.23191 type:complete len:204 (-) Transcript_9802:108-719(-)